MRISGANLIQLLSCLVWFKQFLAFEELRNNNNPEDCLSFSGQFHVFGMEILDIALVNCDNQIILFISANKMAYRPPSHLLLLLNSNFYFFPYSFLWVWNIHGTPYLFQLYIFIVTFLFKEFIKAQYLYTPLALCLIKGTLGKGVVGEEGKECDPRRDGTDHITAKEVRGWAA